MTDLEKQVADLTLKVKVYERNYREAEEFRLKNLKLKRELAKLKEDFRLLKKSLRSTGKEKKELELIIEKRKAAQRRANKRYEDSMRDELKRRRLTKCQR